MSARVLFENVDAEKWAKRRSSLFRTPVSNPRKPLRNPFRRQRPGYLLGYAQSSRSAGRNGKTKRRLGGGSLRLGRRPLKSPISWHPHSLQNKFHDQSCSCLE